MRKLLDKFNYLIVVNKEERIPDNYEDSLELINVKNVWNDEIKIEKRTYLKFIELKKELEKENVYIEIESVYRSVKEQQELWDSWIKEKGLDYVKKTVAVPGYSEHHTGLAIDICIRKNNKLIFINEEMFKEEEIFSKIHKKLYLFGFILRYPKGKENITGYSYEPWHLRYIGDIKIAKEIYLKDLTLEEYL